MNNQNKAVKLANRRRFLKASGLAGIATIIYTVTGVFRNTSGPVSGFIVINGWILPARHFFRLTDD